LDDLEDRLKARGSFPDPAPLDGKIAALQRAKSQLVNYLALLSSPYGPFGRTGFDIIWAYERYRQTLSIAPQLVEACAIPNADKMIGSDLDCDLQLLELHVKHLSEICQGSRNFREHPWYGVSNANLKYQEERELLTALQELRNKAGILYKAVDSLKSTTGFSVEPTAGSIAQLVELRIEVPDWPQTASPEFLSALLNPGERDRVQAFLAEVVAWREKQMEFLLYFSEVPEVPSADLANFVKLADYPRATDCTQYSVQELESRTEAAAALAKQTETLISLFDEIIGVSGSSSACDEGALAEVCVFCQLLEETPPSLLESRQEVLEKETASRHLAEAERESERLGIEQARLLEEFDLDAELSPEDLDKHILELQGATVLKRWFNSNFKTARRYYRELSRRPVRNPQTMATSLRDLQRFQEDFRALQSCEVYHSTLGDHFRGIATNFSELRGLVEWYRNVRQRLSSQRPTAMALMTALFRSSTLRLERVRQIAQNEEVRLRVESVKETARRDFRGSVSENVGSSGNWDFSRLLAEITRFLDLARPLLHSSKSLCVRAECTFSDAIEGTTRLQAHQMRRQRLDTHPIAQLLGSQFVGVNTDIDAIERCLNIASQLSVSRLPATLKQWILAGATKERLVVLRRELDQLNQGLAEYRDASAVFCHLAGLQDDEWYGGSGDSLKLSTVISRCERAIAEGGRCPRGWIFFGRVPP